MICQRVSMNGKDRPHDEQHHEVSVVRSSRATTTDDVQQELLIVRVATCFVVPRRFLLSSAFLPDSLRVSSCLFVFICGSNLFSVDGSATRMRRAILNGFALGNHGFPGRAHDLSLNPQLVLFTIIGQISRKPDDRDQDVFASHGLSLSRKTAGLARGSGTLHALADFQTGVSRRPIS